jgi:hypothetical protein
VNRKCSWREFDTARLAVLEFILGDASFLCTGLLTIVAGAEGLFTGTIDLSKIVPSLRVGDAMSLNAEWIGPSRERITDAASTTVQFSPYTMQISTSVDGTALAPQQDFSVAVTVTPDSKTPVQVTPEPARVSDPRLQQFHVHRWSA